MTVTLSTFILLGDTDHATSRPGPSVPGALAQLMAAEAEVVLVSVHHHGPPDDGVLPGERDHGVQDVELGTATLSRHVAQVSSVPGTLLVLRRAVRTLVRVEVRSSTSAAVGVVSELEIRISMSTHTATGQPRVKLCCFPFF